MGEKREYRKAEMHPLKMMTVWMTDEGVLPGEWRECWNVSAKEKTVADADSGAPGWNTKKGESNKVQTTLPLKNGLLHMRLNQKKQRTVNLSQLAQAKILLKQSTFLICYWAKCKSKGVDSVTVTLC